jgi:phosphoglycerate kinase
MRGFHSSSLALTAKKTVEQLAKSQPGALKDARVFVRVDFNVPVSKKDPNVITDDTRIREAIPTINFLSNHGAKVMLASHSGRPKGKVNEAMRLAPCAKRLSELIGKPVLALKDCIGPDVEAALAKVKGGEIVLLENTRFYNQEEDNDAEFAKKLNNNATVFVNDAFGTAHRAHASTEGVAHFCQHKVAGFLMEKEVKFLQGAVNNPVRPFAAIIGGAKVSTKITVIESLLSKCDKVLLGGGMMFTFYRAMGLNVGKSLVEEDCINVAKELIEKAKAKGVKLILPTDVVIGDSFAATAQSKVVPMDQIPADWLGLDIGPDSLRHFAEEISNCKTVVWNGPMGVFEFEKFASGTFGVAKVLADITSKGAVTIVGGGDSVAAVNSAKLGDKISHVSTGGGASLEMLEGKDLPGVAVLDNA